MARTTPLRIIDGHNDALLRMHLDGITFLERSETGGLDLPRAREGGLAGGLFAVYILSEGVTLPASGEDAARLATAGFPGEGETPSLPGLDYSRAQAIRAVADLFRLERASNGQIALVRTAAELERAIETGVLAAVLHFEGAEAIDRGLDALEVFYRAGLRSLGIVHSRPNIFGHGVPFGFPGSPNTGPGLTEAGRNLVTACNRLRIMIDLSHLNERGFWEVAELSDAPLVATHSCAHSICPATRNLTDAQLGAIGETSGMIGLNFHVGFLREDGAIDTATPLEVLVRHIDHMVEIAGIDCVGLGSDFDYIAALRDLASAAHLPRLVEALRAGGYDGDDLDKVLYRNWIRVLRATWGE